MKSSFLEKNLKIKNKDNYYIYGSFTSLNKRSKGLVIFCHGFTGNKDEHIHFNGAKFMNEKGYDAFRFNFYSTEKGARHFSKTKISQHGQDITEVLNYFKKDYKKIHIVGHSFGGTSLLFTDTKKATTLIFWDGVFINPELEKKDFEKHKKSFGYTINFGMDILVGKDYVKELYSFPDCVRLIKNINIPVKFIGAENGMLKDTQKFFSKANDPKSLSIIKGADHVFNNFKSEEELFVETLNWINKF